MPFFSKFTDILKPTSGGGGGGGGEESESGTPAQNRGRYLLVYGYTYTTGGSTSYNGTHWNLTSDHPDWDDDSGMTTDVTITSFTWHLSNTTYELGDTLSSDDFARNTSSSYHVFGGTDLPESDSRYAADGYHLAGFSKTTYTYQTRWSIDFDDDRSGWVTFWDQIFDHNTKGDFEDVEGSPIITMYDEDGYYYAWELESRDYGSATFQDKFRSRAIGSTYQPTFNVTASTSSIDEGDSVTFTVTGVSGYLSYSTLYYAVSSTDDFTEATATGSFSFSNNTGSFSVTSLEDLTTEGTETFTVGIKTSSSGSIRSSSSNVTIVDTSVSPPVDPEIWIYGEYDPSTGTGNSIRDMVVDSQGFKWHNDGSSLYQMHSNDTIEQWTSQIFRDGEFSSKLYGSNTYLSGQYPGAQYNNSDNTFTLNADGDAWCWDKHGEAFFVWVDYGGASDQKSYIDKYTLSSRFDISTASYDSRTEIESNTDSGRTVLNMNIDATDGLLLVITYSDLANDGIRKYTLSTAWDATTASLDEAETMGTGSRSVFGQSYYSWMASGGAGYWDGTICACWWNGNGTQMFVLFGQSGDTTSVSFRQFLLTERFDLSTSYANGNGSSKTGSGNELPHPIIVDEARDGAVHIGKGQDSDGRTEGWLTEMWLAHQRPYNHSSSTYGTHSLDFEGQSAKLRITGLRMRNALDDHNFLETSSFGISCWFKQTVLKSSDSYNHFFIVDGSSLRLRISINNLNKVQAYFRSYNSGSSGSSSNYTLTGGSTVNDTNWHHLVFCRDNGTYRLYLDGVQVNSVSRGTIRPNTYISNDLAEEIEIGDENMRIADLHISNTNAMYTSGTSFTVPSAQPSLLSGDASTFLLEANALDWNDKTGNIDCIPPRSAGNYGVTTDGTTVQALVTTSDDMPY